MDQLKEFLKQASKHRFWIAIGFAALLPLIAFFVGTGALAEQEKTESGKIKAAHDGAKVFLNGTIQNGQWKDEVKKRTDVLTQDVVRSHEKLYARQEGLLDWPAPVVKTIQEWGPEYPKGVDPQMVNDAILDYTQAYDEYVEKVYKTFEPFNYKDGKGIVAAPPMTALLRPVKFREEKRPSLGDVWAAQRKLWIERTVFDVIAKVNSRAKAKDWDSAAIKQIVLLEVANALALDQKTQPESLEEAKPITPPGQPAPEKSADKPATASPSMPIGGGREIGSMSAMGGGATASLEVPEPVQFVKSANPDQYFIVPIALTVYIEQDRIPDLLVELRNSPMSIRVLDFEMVMPLIPVKKPRKGADASAFQGSMLSSRGRPGMPGGLLGDQIGSAGGGNGGMMSYNPNAGADAYKKAMAGGGGMSAMQAGGPKTAKPKTRTGGKDTTAESLEKLRKNKKGSDKAKEQEKADEDAAESSISNPYFNVVEVKIRGQARFYLPPPKLATTEPTPTANVPPPAAPAKPDAAADAKKADPAKTDAPKTDAKDAPKADPAKADAKGAPKADAPKTDAKDAPAKDAPKADPAKADAAKADAKADPAKADAKDAPKPDPAKTDPAKPKA